MRSSSWLPLMAVATLGLGSCDSKVSSFTDPNLLARIEVIRDCFPNLWTFVDGVADIAGTWKMNGGTTPDPAGLTHTVDSVDGSITATLMVGSTTIEMVIKFYGGPEGAEQNLTSFFDPPSTLGDKIDAAATELRRLFPFASAEKFIHGVYSITGGGVSATDEALTGIIGGSTNQNELEEVRSTLVLVTGGIPAVDPSTTTDSASTPPCTLTLTIPGLITDEEPGQEYPRGTISIVIDDGTTTTNATIVFDKTAIAKITIEGLVGGFDLNLDTLMLTESF